MNDDSDVEDEIDAALEDLLDAHMEDSVDEDRSESESDDAMVDEGDTEFLEGPERLEAFLGLKNKIDGAVNAAVGSKKRILVEEIQDVTSKCARVDADDLTEDVARGPPTNFSRVVTSMPYEALKEKFPKFLESRSRQLDVTLAAGEMLYLPCGWFHEVTSKSAKDTDVPASEKFHMAVNYWFHPPDGNSFQSPYSDSFWPESWKRRNLED